MPPNEPPGANSCHVSRWRFGSFAVAAVAQARRLAVAMDSTQRKIVLVALSAAVVFVWASYVMHNPGGSAEICWALPIGGHNYGLVQVKSWMFLEVGLLRFHIPILVAAALVSFTFAASVTLIVLLLAYLRRLARGYEPHQG